MKAMSVQIEMIPSELTEYNQWVNWSYYQKGNEKPRKVPLNPKTGRWAKWSDPEEWGTFEQTVSNINMKKGLGFVQRKDKPGPIGMIDLDNCIGDFEILNPQAQEVKDSFPQTYWEISPSGKGLRGIFKTSKDFQNLKKSGLELYYKGRFFTVTGNKWEDSPEILSDWTDQLNPFLEKHKEKGENGRYITQLPDYESHAQDTIKIMKSAKAYLLQTKRNLISEICKAPRGTKNNIYNQSSYAMGRIFKKGEELGLWTLESVQMEFFQVAKLTGLEGREIHDTFRSGFFKGSENPKRFEDCESRWKGNSEMEVWDYMRRFSKPYSITTEDGIEKNLLICTFFQGYAGSILGMSRQWVNDQIGRLKDRQVIKKEWVEPYKVVNGETYALTSYSVGTFGIDSDGKIIESLYLIS